MNELIFKAKQDPKYIDVFFEKVKESDFKSENYQKNISDFYEKALYELKFKEENKKMVPYFFSDAFYIKAEVLVKDGKLDEALPFLEKALEWNPVSRNTLVLLCKVNFTKGYYEKAYQYAKRGLEIEYSEKNILYFNSVITVYYLKNKNYSKADEHAINMYLLNNSDNQTLNYLEKRGFSKISPNLEKNEDIMDCLLRVIYDKSISLKIRALYARLLLKYELMPIFKYEKFYLTLESGVKNSTVKDNIILNGSYLVADINEKKFLDIKDKKHLFAHLVISYLDKINEYNLFNDKFKKEKEEYEKEPFLEEIKIKFNGKIYYIANTPSNKEVSKLYFEMKENIIKLATIMTQNGVTVNELFK